MKSLFTFFIILTIALRPLVPLMDYAVNYDFINKNLCENKAKPELLCNGKCYLKKEIAKTSTDQSKNDSRINICALADIFIINDAFVFSSNDFNIKENLKINSEFSNSYNFSLFSKIFHPPLV
ncbi:hypothetical protein [Epilithonimonas lactis]|uniref:Uncharacterized protein n=1 Tax=Epilithonimonas lactis TaxID=421072 RepID=A0A085BLC1_9FLAO|nr:hypothetical protein [Epilithonimonas lactis]KFC23266.1 hypothetical protein IO89_01365 [Epilithonimonas lactis]SEQ07320.1 hypothetical protein SAMN04488097_1232 [Epilithonimonas lactis]